MVYSAAPGAGPVAAVLIVLLLLIGGSADRTLAALVLASRTSPDNCVPEVPHAITPAAARCAHARRHAGSAARPRRRRADPCAGPTTARFRLLPPDRP